MFASQTSELLKGVLPLSDTEAAIELDEKADIMAIVTRMTRVSELDI